MSCEYPCPGNTEEKKFINKDIKTLRHTKKSKYNIINQVIT